MQLGGVRKAYVYLNDGANLYSLTADVTGLVGTYRGKSLVSDVIMMGIWILFQFLKVEDCK